MPLTEQILAIATVLGLLGAALWAASRRQGRLLQGWRNRCPENGRIQIVQRIPLTPQHCLHLVRFQENVLLVGTHPGGIVLAPEAPTFVNAMNSAWRAQEGIRP